MDSYSQQPDRQSNDIAIVGMACLYPGAENLPQYWKNIVNKVDAISDPPAESWDADVFYDKDSTENDRVYCKKGGYIGGQAFFDPLSSGVMPHTVEGGEPDQWLALQIAQQALADAGYGDEIPERERTAVIIGKGTYLNRGNLSAVQHGRVIEQTLSLLKTLHPEYNEHDLQLIRSELKKQLPPFNADTAPGLIPNIIAGRIANRLNLMGPSYTVDGACASSLLAIDMAVENLRSQRCDLAIVGGAHIVTPVPVLMLFCQLNALSRQEQIRPFDAAADGTILGEGIGMVVLKRLAEAQDAGDRIYAVIKGVGWSSDGRGVSVMAPRLDGELLALRRAYQEADVEPDSVGLIEAHGTGTPVGDATEIKALHQIFSPRQRALAPVALGSVKSMISHTMPAAGIAGLIKGALALYHKVLPPTLNVAEPHELLRDDKSPLYINGETRPWIHGLDTPRRAGVNAFGFGGINAHVVLEETPSRKPFRSLNDEWESELCVLTAETREDLLNEIRTLQTFLSSAADSVTLQEVGYSLSQRVEDSVQVRLTIVATGLDDLQEKLDRAGERLGDPACSRIQDVQGIYFFEKPLGQSGKLAFMFAGEGGQYVNMLADLCLSFPEVRSHFDRLDHVFHLHPRDYLPGDLVYPRPWFSEAEKQVAEKRIWEMEGAVEAVLTANWSLYALLNELGVQADALVGHSTGEYSAMMAAGMLDLEDEERLAQFSLELNSIYRQSLGAEQIKDVELIATASEAENVAPLIEPFNDVYIAMENCPHQTVIACPVDAASEVGERLKEKRYIYETLPFDRPYHTPLFEAYAKRLRPFLKKWIDSTPDQVVYSCTSTHPFGSDLPAIHDLAYDHWLKPVAFKQTVTQMYEDGVRLFVEVGTGGSLTAFVRDTLRGKKHVAVAANVKSRSGISQINHVVALLFAHGIPLKLSYLYRYRQVKEVDLSNPAQPFADSDEEQMRMKLGTGWPTMELSKEVAARLRKPLPPGDVPTVEAAEPAPPESDTEGEQPAQISPEPALHNEAQTSDRDADLEMEYREPASNLDVMTSYGQTMQQFLTLQERIMSTFLDGRSERISREGTRPFVGEIISSNEHALTMRCDLDVNEALFLNDHTLGRAISVMDPRLNGLPLMPFTMTMELMAEAADLLMEDKLLIGMEEIRASRWIEFEEPCVPLEIAASVVGESGDRVQVSVKRADGQDGSSPKIVEGVMVFGAHYPDAPQPIDGNLSGGKPSSWSPDALYESGMFHGPAFQGVVSMDQVSDSGVVATLETRPTDRLFRGQREPDMLTDPVLLDLPGQVVGLWTAEWLAEGQVIFPFYLKALRLYRPRVEMAGTAKCHARIDLHGPQQVSSDLDIVGEDDTLWARFEGWMDLRLTWPQPFAQSLLSLQEVLLSELWETPLTQCSPAAPSTLMRLRSELITTDILNGQGGFGQKVLSQLVLSRREREIWRNLQAPDKRKEQWLLGRVAAKDAVRTHLQFYHGITLYPADIEIITDENGRPLVEGQWLAEIDFPVQLSLSHSDQQAAALVSTDAGLAGVGVDLEMATNMNSDVGRMAYSEDELALGDGWEVRMWCAKEAVTKALGSGLVQTPRALVVTGIDRARGLVQMEASEKLRGVLPGRWQDRPFWACTYEDSGVVTALAWLN